MSKRKKDAVSDIDSGFSTLSESRSRASEGDSGDDEKRVTIPGILLNSLPNTGSCYNYQAIRNVFDIPTIMAGSWIWFPNDVAIPSQVKLLAKGGAIAKHHSPASFEFAAPVSYFLDTMWVHVRDPRSVALEWRYSLVTLKAMNQPEILAFLNPRYCPKEFFTLSKTEQIEVQVSNMLPDCIEWVLGWLDAAEDPDFKTVILFTTYEDFLEDEDAHWDRFLDFYGIDRSLWTFEPYTPEAPKNPEHFAGPCHYRNARVDEWREDLTPDQLERACDMIPDRLLKRFGWPRK